MYNFCFTFLQEKTNETFNDYIYPEIGKPAFRKSRVSAPTLKMVVLCEILLY